MGKLSLQGKLWFLSSWALMLMCSAAEPQYFRQETRLTWDEARSHCQVCYKDLVTLSPENTQTIAKELTSDSWIGLRKNFNSTSNSTSSNSTSSNSSSSNSTSSNSSSSNPRMSWSRWSNGDLLSFQNWYPGWPVFKSPFPRRDCCSCSCTCPAPATPRMTTTRYTEFTTPDMTDFSRLENVTDFTDFTNFTDQNVTSFSEWGNASTPNPSIFTTAAPPLLPLEGQCVRSPMLLPDVPDPDENYIEDSCVAMLSFGPWVEKYCWELLPFVCYEDRFFGQVNVSNVTSRSAFLEWLPGPGNISHYRLEVRRDKGVTENLTNTNFTYNLDSLTAGTGYSVRVFPVKCERELNPQKADFFTTPNEVENLTVSKVTKNSISLSWSKPAGGVDFYLINVQERTFRSDTEGKEVDGFTPGNPYTFTVISGVQDNSTWSEGSSITAYTKPAAVSNLKVTESHTDSLILKWELREGNATDYRVKALVADITLFDKVVKETEANVTSLPMGTRITLSVTALANHTLEGDEVTHNSYTAPGPISNLIIWTTADSLEATWSPPEANFSSFSIELLDKNETRVPTTQPTTAYTKLSIQFDGLKTAALYTVIVYSTIGGLNSTGVNASNYTLPMKPTNLTVSSSDKHQLTFKWMAPANTDTVTYSVKLSSSFWGHSWFNVTSSTSHTFQGLQSGTRFEFEVQTKAGERSSEPLHLDHDTDPEIREISLSMLCSSSQVLLCDDENTEAGVFKQLREHFKERFQENIYWSLQRSAESQGA